MKVLIWIVSIFVASFIKVVFFGNASLGLIPALIVYGACIAFANKMCSLWDSHHSKANVNSEDTEGHSAIEVYKEPKGDVVPAIDTHSVDEEWTATRAIPMEESQQIPEIDHPQIENCEEAMAPQENIRDENTMVSSQQNQKICYCRRCGFRLLEDSTFCSRCGTEIKN